MKFIINREFIKLISLRRGYESWTISYSDGLRMLPDGSTQSLWRRPQFRHVKIDAAAF